MEQKDLRNFGWLLLGLFSIAVIVALTFIGSDYLKDSACTAIDSTYDYDGTSCVDASNNSVTVETLTKIDTVISVINIALGLLSLVVLMAIFKVVIKQAKGFGGKDM